MRREELRQSVECRGGRMVDSEERETADGKDRFDRAVLAHVIVSIDFHIAFAVSSSSSTERRECWSCVASRDLVHHPLPDAYHCQEPNESLVYVDLWTWGLGLGDLFLTDEKAVPVHLDPRK